MSRYVEKVLGKDEKIISHAKPHWIIVVRGTLLLAAALLSYTCGADWIRQNPAAFQRLHIHLFVAGVFALWGVFYILDAWISMQFTHYVLTNKRLLKITGVLRKRLVGVMLSRIESIDVDQSLVGQYLRYGNLLVSGTGSTRASFAFVDKALDFREAALDQLDKRADK